MKRHAPATARNSGPIAEVLARELPESGTVLEVASGTGEHALFLARRFPELKWQPSDLDLDALASIEAWREEGGAPANLEYPVQLDASADAWPIEAADAVVCVNMIHISPWSATVGLFAGAARILRSNGPLIVYGPFVEADTITAPSNKAFDASLRARDVRWGLRHVEAVDSIARDNGMGRTARYDMPANNLTLVYRKVA